jgi:Fe-S cluster biosynthesis and repair protein YggX
MSRTVRCVILKRDAEGLDYPPVPGELGRKIFESVSKEGWAMWTSRQTMLINEYRLNLADERAQKLLTEEMEQFFYGAGVAPPPGWVPPAE